MRLILRIVLAGILAVAACAVAANEGRIVFLDGVARIARPGAAAVDARLGDTFGKGTTLTTGAGRMHLRFADGALATLQPNTSFVMADYVFNGRNDGAEQFAGSLVKGALRMVTGLIGRRESRVFRIDGVVATVGIRGTSFKMEYCNNDCGGRPDGLYVDGGEGITVVSNAAGSIDLSRGVSAFVAGPQRAPERTDRRTSVAAPAQRSPAQVIGVVREEQRFADYSFKTGTLEGPFTAINVTRAGAAFAGMEQVPGSGQIGAGTASLGAGETVYVVLDGGNRLFALGAAGADGGSFFAAINNVESAGTDGRLYWGRWANGQVQAAYNFPGDGSSGAGSVDFAGAKGIHYIVSQQVSTIPGAGMASYTFSGGTPSTSNDGVIGLGVTSGTLSVNFAGPGSGTLNMTVGHSGATLNQNGTLALTAGNRAAFTGTGAGSFPFKFEGFFGGGNRADGTPAGAGVSYLIQRPGNFITGVAGFR